MEQLNLKLTLNENGSITATWSPITNATRYGFHVYIPGRGYAVCNEQNLTVTSYTTKPNLEANVMYGAVIAAYGQGYSVLTSDGKKQLIPSDFYRRIPLQVPKNIRAYANPTSIEISFDKTDYAEGYDIRFDNNVYGVTGWGTRITKTIYNLKPQTSHTYAVRSKDSIKTSEYSATQTVVTPAIKPSVPHVTKKTVTENSATISWGAVSGATSYDIRLNGSVQNVTGTSKTLIGLKPATDYTYQIRARTSGGIGDYGPEQTFRTAPTAPAEPRASSQENSVTINWTVAQGADSYDVICNGKEYHVAKPPLTIDGLSPNTSYSYKVRSNSADGSSSYGDVKRVMTSPMPPEASTVKATASKNSVTISWEKVTGANGYDIRFDNGLYHVSGTAKVFSGLSSGKSYTYAVSARNSGGFSTFTDVKIITTIPEIPPVPQNVKIEVAAESAVVSWDGVSRAETYEVKFGDKVYETTGTSLTITGLLPDKSYSCTVRAKNAGGSSAYTASKSVRTLKKIPDVPGGVEASATRNSVTVSWNAVYGAASYDVLFNNITYRVTSGTSRTMAGLNPGTSYTYCVRANNTVGSSAYSKVQTIVTTPNAPKVPANISATATENSVTVKWTASVGADSYDVKLGDKIYNVTGTSTTIMGLSPNTNYTYCVQAKNTGGTSGYSSSRTIRTLLGVPANVTASAETNSVTISWSAVSGASGYDVLFNNQTYSVTGTSKTITGLTPGTNYTYCVRAKNYLGTSAYSAPKQIATKLAPPAVPANVTAVPNLSTKSVTVSWSAVSGANNYELLFNNQTYRVTGTSKTIIGLTTNVNYSYQVRAQNAAGMSAYSAAKTVAIIPVPQPVAPGSVTAVATSNSITISWRAEPNASGYDILFNKRVYSVNGTTKTFTSLSPNTNYTYQIRTRNAAGTSAYSTTYSIKTKIAPPAVPKNVSAVSSLSGVTITWDAVSGADNYDVQFDGQASRVAENQYKIYFDLQPGTEHTYCVRANNEGGSSAYSTLGRIKTKTSRQSGLPEGKWHKTYPDGRIPHLGLDPVNVLNGAFLWDYTFLKDYGKDNLHFTLMYDSQREGCSKILGRGWSHAFNYLLYKDNIYTYFSTPYGEVVPFRKEKDGSGFLPEEGIRSVYAMEQTEDGVYRVRKSDGTTYVFDSNLSPDKIMEGELVSYQFHTDADGRIVRIEGRHGGSLVLTYAGGHISSAADSMGNTARFSYEGDYLISAADCGGNSIAFTYDDDGRLSEITDFSGEKYLTNWYDIYGKVIAQNIAGRGNSTASYDTVNRVTAFTDEAGNQTKYYYNEDSVITCVELGAHAISSSYNENGQVTQQTDLLKNTTQMLYDELGRMTQVTYPDGTDEQISYNDRSYPVRIVNRDGGESLYEYDSRNNLVSARDERGNQCTYVYDENDNLTSYTDKEGNVWTYAYDENHHLSSAADPEGNAYTYSHDKLGRLNSYTSPAGSTVSYQYSSTGNLLSVTDADGSILFEYDKNGNRTSVTDRNGNSQRLEYNDMGQVSLVTDFMGKEYRFEYDERGNLVKETDPLNFHVSYTCSGQAFL